MTIQQKLQLECYQPEIINEIIRLSRSCYKLLSDKDPTELELVTWLSNPIQGLENYAITDLLKAGLPHWVQNFLENLSGEVFMENVSFMSVRLVAQNKVPEYNNKFAKYYSLKEPKFQVTVIPEPTNPYDPKALSVFFNKDPVGYIARSDQPEIDRHAAWVYKTGSYCRIEDWGPVTSAENPNNTYYCRFWVPFMLTKSNEGI